MISNFLPMRAKEDTSRKEFSVEHNVKSTRWTDASCLKVRRTLNPMTEREKNKGERRQRKTQKRYRPDPIAAHAGASWSDLGLDLKPRSVVLSGKAAQTLKTGSSSQINQLVALSKGESASANGYSTPLEQVLRSP